MSVNTFGPETFTATRKPAGPLAAGATKVLSVLFAIGRVIVQEILYMLAQDIANGKIRKEPEDWER